MDGQQSADDLELAAVLQGGTDAGREQAVRADLGSKPLPQTPFLSHYVHVGLSNRVQLLTAAEGEDCAPWTRRQAIATSLQFPSITGSRKN